MRDPKVLTPLFYVGKPIGRSIRAQPAIRSDAINDDGGVPKNFVEKLDILGVETIDVIVDEGLDFVSGGPLFGPLQIEKNLMQLPCWLGINAIFFSSCERHVTVHSSVVCCFEYAPKSEASRS